MSYCYRFKYNPKPSLSWSDHEKIRRFSMALVSPCQVAHSMLLECQGDVWLALIKLVSHQELVSYSHSWAFILAYISNNLSEEISPFQLIYKMRISNTIKLVAVGKPIQNKSSTPLSFTIFCPTSQNSGSFPNSLPASDLSRHIKFIKLIT